MTTTPTTSPVSADFLNGLEPGRRVADAQHDLWVKLAEGTWIYLGPEKNYVLSAEDLLHVWGPVTIIPKEGL